MFTGDREPLFLLLLKRTDAYPAMFTGDREPSLLLLLKRIDTCPAMFTGDGASGNSTTEEEILDMVFTNTFVVHSPR